MSESKPNIVLVSMDSLRADYCGFLGSDRKLTPTMDTLAKNGVSFENAVTPGPQTFSSMPALFTGRPRQPDDSLESFPGDTYWERRLSAIQSHVNLYPTIAERLQRRGYTTAGVTPNPWTSKAAGFDTGFDYFVDHSSESGTKRPFSFISQIPGVDTEDRAVKLVLTMLTGSSFFSKWTDLFDEILSLKDTLSEPYFLWVFLLDTHYPFMISREDRTEQSLLGMYYSAYKSEKLMRGRVDSAKLSPGVKESLLRGYRDTIRASDTFLERFISETADDPVVIVHSDHGESFGEHGNYGHHHRDVYEENIHVPYLIYNAGSTADVSDPISLSTLYQTIFDISRDGFTDPHQYTEEYVVSRSECGTNSAVRGSRFKYIETAEKELLFDLHSDPIEQSNIARENPERVAKFQQILNEYENTRSESQKLASGATSVATKGLL